MSKDCLSSIIALTDLSRQVAIALIFPACCSARRGASVLLIGLTVIGRLSKDRGARNQHNRTRLSSTVLRIFFKHSWMSFLISSDISISFLAFSLLSLNSRLSGTAGSIPN